MAKRLLLTMSDELYGTLEKKRAELGYMTIQEIINDIVRRSLFAPQPAKKGKAGRPPKVEEPFLEYFSRATNKSVKK